MKPKLKHILAIVAGIIAAGTVIAGVESLSALVYKPEIMPKTDEEYKQYIANAPFSAKLILFVAYAIGSFVGTYIACRISPKPKQAFLVLAVVLFLLGLYNFITIPSGIILTIFCLIAFPVFSYLAYYTILKTGKTTQ